MTTDRTTRQPGSRPDKHDYATLDDQTWFVHGGNRADDTTGAIRTPIVMANSYQHPSANTASSGWPLGWNPPTICSPISTPPSTPPSAPPGLTR